MMKRSWDNTHLFTSVYNRRCVQGLNWTNVILALVLRRDILNYSIIIKRLKRFTNDDGDSWW